VTIEETKSYCM